MDTDAWIVEAASTSVTVAIGSARRGIRVGMAKILRRLHLLLAFWVLAAGSAMAEDLLQAYQQAFATTPALVQAQDELQAQMQDRPMARAALLPHIGIGANIGENTANITGFGSPIATNYLSNGYSVSLIQPVFNGQVWTAFKQADSHIQASTAALAYAEEQLALQVAQCYFGILEAQAQERVAENQKKLMADIYKQTEAYLQVGTGDIIAMQEARARLDSAEASLIKANNAVTVAERKLQRLTHSPVDILDDVGHFEVRGPYPDDMQAWVNDALKNHPLIQQAEAQLRTARQQIEYNRRARWPVVNLQAVAQHSLGTLLPGLDMNQAGVSLNLNAPLYEGGLISASVQQAEAQSRASADHLADVRDQVTLDSQTTFLNLKDSVARLQAAKEALASAQVSLDGTRKGYEVGTRSIIDLLTTITDYIRAEQDYNAALYNQVVARVQLKAATGILNQTDMESINALLNKNSGSQSP